MYWVKLLLDNNFHSIWKTIELSALDCMYGDILWKSFAPESVLNKLNCTQLADSLRTWYVYRESAVNLSLGIPFSDLGACQSLWFNKNVRSKSKQYFYYEDWCDKGILYVDDLLNPPHPGSKLFEELILDFDISKRDRRKFNFLIKNVPSSWIDDPHIEISNLEIFDKLVDDLVQVPKVPRHAYSIMIEKCVPDKRVSFWNEFAEDPEDLEWDKIHVRNFKCSIDSRFRSFYFKIFHKAIAFNDFLYKIKRRDSPDCVFCNKMPETITHVFCECEIIKPLWEDMVKIIRDKDNIDFDITIFDKMFGVPDDMFLTYLFLSVKYYIYVCKFQNKTPTCIGLWAYVKTNRETEYFIAKKKNKLSCHFRKWRFDI